MLEQKILIRSLYLERLIIFEQLGYEKAEIYDIYSDESTLEQLQVKFLWDQLTDYPHGKVKDADVV